MSDDEGQRDPATLRAVARLARARAVMPRSVDHRDALERLGAERALMQLATDLEATASYLEGEEREGGS